MRFTALAGLWGAVLLTGCAAPPTKSFRTDVTISPAKEVGQYVVEFKIAETEPDGSVHVVSAPKVTVLAGQQAKISIQDETSKSGVFCKALITEADNSVETVTSVRVKQDGRDVWSSTQKTTIRRHSKSTR